jgi:hypothetical protein
MSNSQGIYAKPKQFTYQHFDQAAVKYTNIPLWPSEPKKRTIKAEEEAANDDAEETKNEEEEQGNEEEKGTCTFYVS